MTPELRNSVVRDEKGRVVGGGGSLNPGGVSKKLRKVRRALEKLDDKMVRALNELADDGDPKVRAKAVEIWAKYRLPVPKETKAEQEARGAAPRLPESLREKLARWQ